MFFFVSNGTIDRVKPVTHAADLRKMFPDFDIDNL